MWPASSDASMLATRQHVNLLVPEQIVSGLISVYFALFFMHEIIKDGESICVCASQAAPTLPPGLLIVCVHSVK
jgi:hypothetical protein